MILQLRVALCGFDVFARYVIVFGWVYFIHSEIEREGRDQRAVGSKHSHT